jgi:dienelactone hydrolase
MDLQPLAYEAEGREFSGWLADGSSGARGPGVLVIHEGGGLGRHTRERALQLAELGYVAYAMDLFGLAEFDLEQAKAIVAELRADVGQLRGRMTAALGALASHSAVDPDRLAAIGYCFGGAAAIELARTGGPLAAIAGFHAGVIPGTAQDDLAIRGKVLLCHGADDPAVPPSQIRTFVEGLSKAGVDWQLHLYGGVGHSFTNRDIDAWKLPGFAYDERADRRSWAAMLGLFEEVFG